MNVLTSATDGSGYISLVGPSVLLCGYCKVEWQLASRTLQELEKECVAHLTACALRASGQKSPLEDYLS